MVLLPRPLRGGGGFSVTVDDRGFDKKMREAIARVDDLTPAMQIAGQIMQASVERNFQEEGRPKKWKRSQRVASEAGGKTLTLSSILKNSVTTKPMAGHLLVHSNLVYAATHQFGDDSRGIPARPYLVVQEEDAEDIAQSVVAFVEGAFA